MKLSDRLRQAALVVATSAITLTACDSVKLDDPPAIQETPATGSTASFAGISSGAFLAGTSPTSAAFSGGSTDGSSWLIPEGGTGIVNLETAASRIAMMFQGGVGATSQQKSQPVPSRNATNGVCGVSDQGLDNTAPLSAQVFVRGLAMVSDNSLPATDSARFAVQVGVNDFIAFDSTTLQAEFEVGAGSYEYKIADAGWSVEWSNSDSPTTVGAAITLPGGASAGAPNSSISIAEDGCYNFTVDATDPENIVMTVTKVDLSDDGGGDDGGGGGDPARECGVTDQGMDNTAPLGAQVFARGLAPVDDPSLPANDSQRFRVEIGTNDFINFGNNILQAEFEIVAGNYEFKIADAGWSVEWSNADSAAMVDTSITLPGGASAGAPNTALTIAATACYNLLLDATDPENVILLITEADLGGGGGPVTPAGVCTVKVIDVIGGQIQEVEGSASSTRVEVTRSRSLVAPETLIKQVQVDNSLASGMCAVSSFSWETDVDDAAAASEQLAVNFVNVTGNYDNVTVAVDDSILGMSTVSCVAGASGCVFTIDTTPFSTVTFTVLDDGVADPGGAISIDVFGIDPDSAFSIVSGSDRIVTSGFGTAPALGAAAHWVLRDTLLWNPPAGATSAYLLYSPDAGFTSGGALKAQAFPLQPGTSPDLPNMMHLSTFAAWTLPTSAVDQAATLVRGQLSTVALDAAGNIVGATTVQIPGVLDDLYASAALDVNLGVTYSGSAPSVKLWAPTANSVTVNVYDNSSGPPCGIGNQGLDDAEPLGDIVYVRGGFNDWGTANPLYNFGGGILQAEIEIAGGDYEYKIANEGWDQEWTNGTVDTLIGTPITLPAGSDGATNSRLSVASGGCRNFSVDTADPDNLVLTVTDLDPVVSMVMDYDETTGVWSAEGTADWDRKFYTYTVNVYAPTVGAVVNNEVTDPYSISLSQNSQRSQFVNLDDSDLKPPGWDDLVKPALEAPEDIVIYELHVRDFSARDDAVMPDNRGKYAAFGDPGSRGRMHLTALAEAGLTHVHLLPSFDIATINEDPQQVINLPDPVDALCDASAFADPDFCSTYAGMTLLDALEAQDGESDIQQDVVTDLSGLDSFNWGYDPWHYTTPEGSYATDADGPQRIYEFRSMVQALSDMGLRTVMDVVYNHTNASGQSSRSVLDRVVPGYYHRRTPTSGSVENSTCCDNTATEHAMMGKLMVDSLAVWTGQYKVDGFRFDLMGFHTLDNLLEVQQTLTAIDPTVYLYGEGWNFGEVQDNRRFVQARQGNVSGTGIGTFSDRLRDAVRGGGPFDSGEAHISNQGFASGSGYDPNANNDASDPAFREAALLSADQIRVGMAGHLTTFSLIDREGELVSGSGVPYGGQSIGTGYVDDPQEVINYTGSHDNETFWDISQYKHPAGTPIAERARAHNVGLDTVLLAQGVPLLHAGQDMLRSKSMDRDSFNSGDWFNLLDFSYQSNNWRVGLPVAGKNESGWPQISQIFADASIDPTMAEIVASVQHTQEMLKVRKSTRLFRLRNADEIRERVRYYNTGPDQIPGLIVQGLDGCVSPDFTPEFGFIVSVLNATDDDQTFELFTGDTFELHPVLAASTDPVVATAAHDASGFFVPARTTAVFTRAQQFSCEPFGVDIFVRGINGDWSANPDNQLAFLGDGIYQANIPDVAVGGQSFKIADEGWSSGSDCGASDTDVVTLDTELTMNCAGGGNFNFDVPEIGGYTFTVDANDIASPTLTVSTAPPYDVDLFVRGLNEDWSANDSNRLKFVGNDVYRVVIDGLPAGADDFKIADEGWTSGTDCGAAGPAVLDTALVLDCAGGPNISIDLPVAGSYSLTLEASDPAAPALTVEKTPYDVPIFIRGLQGDWSANPVRQFDYVGSKTYEVTLESLPAGMDDFKIADEGWTSGTDCGSSDPLMIGMPLVLDCAGGGNIGVDLPAAGDYIFSLDGTTPATPALTVTGQ